MLIYFHLFHPCDQNIGLCKEDPFHKHFDPRFGERPLSSQVSEFYSSNVPRPPEVGLFGSRSGLQRIVGSRSEVTRSSTELPSGDVQWGTLRDEGPSDPPPSFFSPYASIRTTLSAKEEKSMLEAAANTTTEDAPEYSLTSHLIASHATNEEDGQGPTPATDEVDGSLLRLLRLSAQEQDAPSATSRIGSED